MRFKKLGKLNWTAKARSSGRSSLLKKFQKCSYPSTTKFGHGGLLKLNGKARIEKPGESSYPHSSFKVSSVFAGIVQFSELLLASDVHDRQHNGALLPVNCIRQHFKFAPQKWRLKCLACFSRMDGPCIVRRPLLSKLPSRFCCTADKSALCNFATALNESTNYLISSINETAQLTTMS